MATGSPPLAHRHWCIAEGDGSSPASIRVGVSDRPERPLSSAGVTLEDVASEAGTDVKRLPLGTCDDGFAQVRARSRSRASWRMLDSTGLASAAVLAPAGAILLLGLAVVVLCSGHIRLPYADRDGQVRSLSRHPLPLLRCSVHRACARCRVLRGYRNRYM